jgi:hypothetical protein
VSHLKLRVGLLGMLAMLLVGSFAAASAEANQGPFWYHRAIGGQGKGVKLSGQQGGLPFEEVRGGGPEVKFSGKAGGVEVEMTAEQVQIKGIVYNNAIQGQAKLAFAYFNVKVLKPGGGCVGKVGSNNVVKVFGHLAWTYAGNASELKEQPVQNQKPLWLFTGQELQQGATTLPTEVPFTAITLSVCASALTATVKGTVVATIKPEQLGAFSTTQIAESAENGTRLHFWNGSSNNEGKSSLVLGTEPALLKQVGTVNAFGTQEGAAQELGVWGD